MHAMSARNQERDHVITHQLLTVKDSALDTSLIICVIISCYEDMNRKQYWASNLIGFGNFNRVGKVM